MQDEWDTEHHRQSREDGDEIPGEEIGDNPAGSAPVQLAGHFSVFLILILAFRTEAFGAVEDRRSI